MVAIFGLCHWGNLCPASLGTFLAMWHCGSHVECAMGGVFFWIFHGGNPFKFVIWELFWGVFCHCRSLSRCVVRALHWQNVNGTVYWNVSVGVPRDVSMGR